MDLPAVAVLAVVLASGCWLASVLSRLAWCFVAGRSPVGVAAAPLRDAVALLLRQRTWTERSDRMNWLLAPALYLMLAAVGLSVVPFGPGLVVADLDAGIVLWGACEALTVVVVFLHGWSPNSPLPLIAAYRYVAVGLPVMLLSMFVLIAAALPAESLSVGEIVEAQQSIWNVLRQPLGLAAFLMLGLALTLNGPFNYGDPADLAGGTSAEDSGSARLAWEGARTAMLAAVAAMASAAFLGGYHGPWLAGPHWLLLKMTVLMALMAGTAQLLARLPPARMLTLLWTVLLPLVFLDLALVGAVLLA